jgi:hypothetical protein
MNVSRPAIHDFGLCELGVPRVRNEGQHTIIFLHIENHGIQRLKLQHMMGKHGILATTKCSKYFLGRSPGVVCLHCALVCLNAKEPHYLTKRCGSPGSLPHLDHEVRRSLQIQAPTCKRSLLGICETVVRRRPVNLRTSIENVVALWTAIERWNVQASISATPSRWNARGCSTTIVVVSIIGREFWDEW